MRQLVGTIGVVLTVAACKPVASSASASPRVKPRIVIVDAGSSGTRIHVYDASEPALVDLTPACDDGPPLAQTGPGAVLGLWQSCAVSPLVDPSTPIRVYATAGMRSLAETEADRAAQIHAELAAELRERGQVDVASRTIDGTEEARWAWIAVNSIHETSVGILELGGSSTQIAFVPDDPTAATEVLTLDGRRWPLFAVSYLHCGANDARRELAAASCFPRACESHPECAASLIDTPATHGAGDFSTCTATIEERLRDRNARCPAASEPRPPMIDERFVLVGNFAQLVRNLGAVRADGEVDLAQLWTAAERACAAAWSELDETSRSSKICFDAALTHALLELYGLSGSTMLSVLDQDPEWALGAAYLEHRLAGG
jgi:hypothetical protein